MSNLKFKSKQEMRYTALHRKIVDEGFRFNHYYYQSRAGTCECGQVGLSHHFVLANPDASTIILGSTCINRHENYAHVFKNYPKSWKGLMSEIKEYEHLFRMIKSSEEYKKQKWKLEDLQKLRKEERARQNRQTNSVLPYLEAYAWMTGTNFLASLLSQAREGRRLSDRQIEVYNKIVDEYNAKNDITPEIVLFEYDDWASKPHFEDDFRIVTPYLRLGTYDQDTLNRLDGHDQFSEDDMRRARRLLKRYRKQMHVIRGARIPDNRTDEATRFNNAFDRLKEARLIPDV